MQNVKLCLCLLLIVMLSSVFSCNCNQEELERFNNGIKNSILKKTEISATDNTPPTLVWEVTDLSSGLPPTTFSAATNPVTIFYGSNLKVVLKAEDPESGVRNMSWDISSSYSCKSSRLDVATQPFFARESAYIPDLGEYVFKRYQMVMDRESRLSLNFCSSLEDFEEGYYNIRASATNHQGITNSSSLAFGIIKPPMR